MFQNAKKHDCVEALILELRVFDGSAHERRSEAPGFNPQLPEGGQDDVGSAAVGGEVNLVLSNESS